MTSVPLSSLRPGTDGRLEKLDIYGSNRRRLQDLGFLQGMEISCAHVAPSGSPVAVVCKGTLLALRKETCDNILVSVHDL